MFDIRNVVMKSKISQNESGLGYAAHRGRQQRRIVDAARSLFAATGIDQVSMLEITAAAGVQPSTLYQYFKKKEDIVWAITGQILSGFRDRVQMALEQQTTGPGKIGVLLDNMANDLEARPEEVRFMAQFDVLYAREFSVEALLRMQQDAGLGTRSDLDEWISSETAGKSIHTAFRPGLTMQAVLNLAVGTQRRLASLGSKVEAEYGQPPTMLFREAMRIVLLGLGAEPKTADVRVIGKQKKAKKRTGREK